MVPGPDLIIACPACEGLAKYMTLASGNTFGARVWTDGKQIAPMLPRPPAVVKCRHCGACFWLDDAEEVGSIEPWRNEGKEVNPAWAAPEEVEEPSEKAYYQAIAEGLAKTPEQERDLRVFAWWRRNDAFRDDPEAQAGDSAAGPVAWKKNLEALAGLLTEEDIDDALMKAEVLRELGQFEPAKEVLSRIDSIEYGDVIRQFRALCDRCDAHVRELHFDD